VGIGCLEEAGRHLHQPLGVDLAHLRYIRREAVRRVSLSN
jgi:hypothetical protein